MYEAFSTIGEGGSFDYSEMLHTPFTVIT